jgi:hypothetical protein
VELDRLNELIRFFGERQKAAIRAEQRGSLTSPLFDLRRRSVLGWQLKYDHTAPLLRDVAAVLAPEEVGRRMKRPGGRPYFLQLFLMLQDVLGARQQRMLELGLADGDRFPDERLDDLAFVADFWERSSRAYRNDGLLVPEDAGNTLPILSDDTLAQVRELLVAKDDGEFVRARRLLAILQSYCFIAHGEQRDGVFGHGPYPSSDGRTMFFRELNDLRSDFLPWTRTATRNVWSAFVIAYECRDVSVRCDFFGGLVTDPLEFSDRVERFAVLTLEDGEIRPLDPASWAEAEERGTQASTEVYQAVVDWPDGYRAAYGAHLFANHLKPFADLAGLDRDDQLAAAAEETIARHLDDLLAGPEVPAAMARWGAAQGPFFFPVVV